MSPARAVEAETGEKFPDSRYVLKGGTVEFAHGMDVSMKEKESRMTSRFLA